MMQTHPLPSAGDTPVRVCLTPTRNENWIIEAFLAAAKTWADHVIVADQGSTDGTLEILRSTDGIDVAINSSTSFDESYRQKLLLSHARRIGGQRILLGLDADEALSANSVHSGDWHLIEQAKPGTILRFKWVNVLPGFTHAWIPPNPIPFGFVDDGSEHVGQRIHSPRVPQPTGAPVLDLNDIVVLHFQYTAWERMASKQRWYQAWEYTQHEQKGALDIFRQYHHMHGGWPSSEIHPIRPEWFRNYEEAGLNFRALKSEPLTWWDGEILEMLYRYGPAHFRRIAIWNHDWNAVAQRAGKSGCDLRDPRSAFEKTVHSILRITQSKRAHLPVRGLEWILRRTGW